MSFESLLIHTITIKNRIAGSTTRHGDETETFDAGTSCPARVQQLAIGGAGQEELEGQDRRVTYFRIFTQADVTVSSTSMIIWGAHRLEVFGQPSLVNDAAGSHHYEIQAREVLGG